MSADLAAAAALEVAAGDLLSAQRNVLAACGYLSDARLTRADELAGCVTYATGLRGAAARQMH